MEMLHYKSPASPLEGSATDYNSILSRPVMMPTPRPDLVFTREDHMVKELSLLRETMRSPRRSQTHQNYKVPVDRTQPSSSSSSTARNEGGNSREEAQEGREATVVVTTPLPDSNQQLGEQQQQPRQQQQPERSRRPALGPPRRSYSVMDYEPLPHHHRPSPEMSLMDIPSELHHTIVDFLDPIDSTCLGLANKHFYAIHRRRHGSVALSTRRSGPNELEWAWHVAGAVRATPLLALPPPATMTTTDGAGHSLARLRVRGQAYCRKCGVTRCELVKHLRAWMGDGLEYCEVTGKVGPAAPPDAKSFCYMSVPSNPNRCGRHKKRKSQVVLR